MEESLILDGVRSVFAMLDRMVYSLISIFYNTIMDLANVQILKTSQINELTGRIYALIGIFMIFKVSFSLISYLVDPDKMMDKNAGAGTLIKNIVITFVLIVSVPFAFDMLYEAQSAILSDQIIPRFIFGDTIESSDAGLDKGGYNIYMFGCDKPVDDVKNMGNYIGLAIFKPFFVPEQREPLKGLPTDMKDWYCSAGAKNGEPSVANLLSKSDLYNAPKGFSTTYNYDIDYSFFISTAIGVVIALILLSFCFDVATRILRLLFLEIIAPIPIMSYIDPNSAKSGTFSKWLKEVSGTWISLFTRLASLFLAVYVIQIVSSGSELYFSKGYEFEGNVTWLKLLIIIGALVFAKQLPKLLEDVLGFKLGGNMTLNPFKKLESEALGGKQIFGTAGNVARGAAVGAGTMVGASIGSGVANAYAAEKGNKMKAFGQGLGTGAFYGAKDGYLAGYSGKKAKVLDVVEKNSRNRNLTADLVEKGAAHKPFALPRYMARNKITDITGKRGVSGTTDLMKDQINDLNIKTQLAMQKQQEASRTISDIKAGYKGKYMDQITTAFSRDINKNADGTLARIKRADGADGFDWANNVENMDAKDFITTHGLTFNKKDSLGNDIKDASGNIVQDLDARKEFIDTFDNLKSAEISYRTAYEDAISAEKEKNKLEKQKGKFEDIGKK